MQGITIDELRARHAALVEERQRELRAWELKNSGYGYVLGEIEAMIAELEARTNVEPNTSANDSGAAAGSAGEP